MIRIGSLFAGIGGFELGLESACPGAKTIWQVEKDPFCQKVLKKHWPDAALFSDVCQVGKHNLEAVDILCGGFPCQDISIQGRGRGLDGEKSSLWFEMLRIISELRPRVALVENVPAITFRGLSRICGGLSEVGYDSEWGFVSAREFGAPHLRERFFCIAYPTSEGSSSRLSKKGQWKERSPEESDDNHNRSNGGARKSQWSIEPRICRMVNGVPDRAHRLRGLGNAIVPKCSEYVGLQLLKSGILDDLI